MRIIATILCLALVHHFEFRMQAANKLEWQAGKDFKWAALNVSGGGKTGFTLLPPEQSGVAFTNSLDEKAAAANRVLYNGSGVAVGDYDNDGLSDIFFCSLT